MEIPVYEVPLSSYAKMTVDAFLPKDIADLQKRWFTLRCAAVLGLDTTFVPQTVLDSMLREAPNEGDFRGFVFSARNIAIRAEINMALVPRGTDIPEQRLTVTYPGETFSMEVHTGGGDGKTAQHEFRRTGIDLLTGDHIYREQEEA